MLFADLTELQQLLAPALDLLPQPSVESQQWSDLAAQFPIYWKQLIKLCVATTKKGPVAPSPAPYGYSHEGTGGG